MAIEHKRLGKHGVLVSNICLGTMNFGWHTSQDESFKMMDRALDLGTVPPIHARERDRLLEQMRRGQAQRSPTRRARPAPSVECAHHGWLAFGFSFAARS